MKRLLLDTNGYSLAMRGDPQTVEILQRADHIGLSVISLGELLSGFALGGREPKNRAELEAFLDSPRVRLYAIDETTADFYAQVLGRLRKKARPIPTNDIWIAAVCFQHGLKLLTKDRHFEHVDGLTLNLWSYE